MSVDITIDLKSVEAVAKELVKVKKEAPKIMSRALNRTAQMAKTDMKREAVARYEIKSSDVQKTLKVFKSTPKHLEAKSTSAGGQISLGHFKTKGYRVIGRDNKPHIAVKVKIKKTAGYESLNNDKPQPAFFVGYGQKKPLVFRRVGKKRLPITKQFALSIPQMISNPEALKTIQTKATANLEKRMNHELERAINRVNGGSKK